MKHLKNFTLIAVSTLFLTACKKESKLFEDKANLATEELSGKSNSENDDEFEGGNKHVYTLGNQTAGNKVLEYTRNNNGTLTYNTAYTTGGTGTGGGLGNQGALIITQNDDEATLLAINAGSNSISSFKITGNGLQLKSTVSCGGMRPVSVTQHDDVVYVLNAGGSGNISGFTLDDHKLIAIANSSRPLSSVTAGAAQISFVNDGKAVAVTEKATNKIITYTINASGTPGIMHSITSSSPTPFGFAVGNNGNIFVSEAVGGAAGASKLSSYHIAGNGVITAANVPVGANQSAACWVVITNNGKYAYTTNTASNNISAFNINTQSGNINLHTAIAAVTGMGPIDAALNNNSKYLYILNSGSKSIGVYAVSNNGSLNAVQNVLGLPAGSTGMAAQ